MYLIENIRRQNVGIADTAESKWVIESWRLLPAEYGSYYSVISEVPQAFSSA
jgi:hypothetical protein